MDNFAGAAAYYDKYRPQLPQAAIECVMSAVTRPTSLLDLGTGTGHILEQFAPYFSSIIAVEPDRDMFKYARTRLMNYPVKYIHDTAEGAQLPPGWTASLTTIAHAFHWMNRPAVLGKLESVMAPGGVIALLGSHSFWNLHNEWSDVVRETIQEFLGPERQTLSGTFQHPSRPYSEDFAESAFSVVEQHNIPVTRFWTTEQIIGWLYSSSYASKALLKENAPRFEERLRKRLANISPQDLFEERNFTEVQLATRPA